MWELGNSLVNGWLPRDPIQSNKWLKRAADLGLPWAYTSLAKHYEMGRLGPRNPAKAVEWYLIGSEKTGQPHFLGSAGWVEVREGLRSGDASQEQRGRRRLEDAIEHGEPKAAVRYAQYLAGLYLERAGVTEDDRVEARALLEKTHRTTRAGTWGNLNSALFRAQIPTSDSDEIDWLDRAIAAGSKKARERLFWKHYDSGDYQGAYEVGVDTGRDDYRAMYGMALIIAQNYVEASDAAGKKITDQHRRRAIAVDWANRARALAWKHGDAEFVGLANQFLSNYGY